MIPPARTNHTATHRGHAAVVARLRAAGCVYAEDEADLLLGAATSAAELEAMVLKRIDGLPLEQVVGWARFCGLRIAVEAGVFVPRRRTELLARRAMTLAGSGSVVVDLCCGAGAVAAAIGASINGIELHAADIGPAAVACARHNLEPLGGRVHEGDLYSALPAELMGRIDVLVVNAPYVPTGEIRLMPPEARDHEPRVTLDGGSDGVEIQRRVADSAGTWLAAGGRLLVETSQRQAPLTVSAFARNNLWPEVVRDDDFDATVVVGQLREEGTEAKRTET